MSEKIKNQSNYENQIIHLKGEIAKLNHELERQKLDFHNNIPKLIGTINTRLEKVRELVAAMSIYQTNIQQQLDHLRDGNEVALEVAIEAIQFFTSKNIDLINRTMEIIEEKIGTDDKVESSHAIDDYVFNEFRVDSRNRKITINGKTIKLSQVEFTYLHKLVEHPNQDVTYDDPKLARVNIGRLKNRVPELKALIKTVYGKAFYRLQVSAIASK